VAAVEEDAPLHHALLVDLEVAEMQVVLEMMVLLVQMGWGVEAALEWNSQQALINAEMLADRV